MVSRPHIVDKYKENAWVTSGWNLISASISVYCSTGRVCKHYTTVFCRCFFFFNWIFTQATWSSITYSHLHCSILQLLYQHKHNKVSNTFLTRCGTVTPLLGPPSLFLCPHSLFFDSLLLFSLFHRLRETKDMSRYWFVLCFPVHSFLLHHCPLGENHPGSPCHRDQRHTLLLPDALHCAVTHLPQVSMMEKLKHLGFHRRLYLNPRFKIYILS